MGECVCEMRVCSFFSVDGVVLSVCVWMSMLFRVVVLIGFVSMGSLVWLVVVW